MESKYKFVKKIRKGGTSLAINIPQEVVEIMGLKEDEMLEIEVKKMIK